MRTFFEKILATPLNSLSGTDTLYMPSTVVKRLEKDGRIKKCMDIKLNKTNIRKQEPQWFL